MLNAGFQYLEQRDANDTITKNGVVGKNSPFATSDNSGIYDVIAEDLRWLKENIDDVKDTSDLEAIKQSVTEMYNTMKNDSSFGEATAKAQAEEAKRQAQAALESATNAKTYRDDVVAKSTEINDTVAEIKTYIERGQALIESNRELEQTLGSYVTVASNKAKIASDSATKAATSETNAKASETKAKTSETNAKVSETNAATSESNAAISASNAKTSETNAKASETNSANSAQSSSDSSDLSKAWSVSTTSPDNIADNDSPTSKTQSSRTWALYSRDRAISALNSETSASTSASNAADSESSAKTSETNASASAEHAADSEAKAKTSESNAATSAEHAATSETNASASETKAKASETNAKTSETNAAISASSAATSESNAKSHMDTTKGYMDKAQEAYESAQAIQSIVDTAKANAEKCLADVEAVRDSLAKMITYQGSVDNYFDLPTSPQVGYSYNIKNADKTHGVNAGDNVVWNGTDWDNLGGAVDMSLFAELGKDARFNTVAATTFNGDLVGTASKATADANGNNIANTYIQHCTELGSVDLDTVKTDGLYTASRHELTTLEHHYPKAGNAGSLLVMGNTNDCTQIFTTYITGYCYIRTYRSDMARWNDWCSLLYISDLDYKQDKLTFDATPTANSSNPVTSAGIKAAIDAKTVDLSNYYTKTQVDTAITNAISAITDGDNKSY